MEEFLSMGGYGAFVWPAYIITAATLVALVVLTLRRAKRARARLSALSQDEARTGR